MVEKPKPQVLHERDAIVKVTLASICSSDLHIKHGSVPRAVEGITVGHEMVGIVEEVGSAVTPEKCLDFVRENSDHDGADVVFEVAGAENIFELAWRSARPNAIVTVVALYDKAQTLPLPDMYGKNLTFKTGGVDGCDCEETLKLIAEGKLDTEPLITHTYPLSKIDEAYELFEEKRDGVIKVALECSNLINR